MPPDIAPGAFVADGAHLDDSVSVESGAVIHAGVRLGPGCLVEAGAVVGKRPRLRPGSSAEVHGEELGPLVLGEAVTVCAGAVVYAGSWIGEAAIIGDQVQVRERSRIGAGTVVGRGSTVDFQSVVGERVRIQTSVYVTGGMVVEDEVFLGPGVVTTNDHTMGRHGPAERLLGPILRHACRIGGGAVLAPGVEIGEEAFVAAGSVVTRDVAPRQVVMGVPARMVREVGDADLIERWK